MTVKLLNKHHLESLSLKGGYTGLSVSTLVKMPHRWKSRRCSNAHNDLFSATRGHFCCCELSLCKGIARMLKKLRTSMGDHWIKQWFSSITSLFKLRTSLKGKNLLPEGANSFLYEQFLIVWKIFLPH